MSLFELQGSLSFSSPRLLLVMILIIKIRKAISSSSIVLEFISFVGYIIVSIVFPGTIITSNFISLNWPIIMSHNVVLQNVEEASGVHSCVHPCQVSDPSCDVQLTETKLEDLQKNLRKLLSRIVEI